MWSALVFKECLIFWAVVAKSLLREDLGGALPLAAYELIEAS